MPDVETTTGYTVKDTGEKVSVPYTYPNFEADFETALEYFGGEEKACSVLQQVAKEDSGNNAREKAKVENGHSTRAVLTEEQKATNKASRAKVKTAISKLKTLTPEQLSELGIEL